MLTLPTQHYLKDNTRLQAVGEMLPLWQVSDWLQRRDSGQPGSEHTSGGAPRAQASGSIWAEGLAGHSACSPVKHSEPCSRCEPEGLSRATARACCRLFTSPGHPPWREAVKCLQPVPRCHRVRDLK